MNKEIEGLKNPRSENPVKNRLEKIEQQKEFLADNAQHFIIDTGCISIISAVITNW